MATDLTVRMEDRPGALAELGTTLGRAGVNLAGGCAATAGGEGVIHVLVEGDPSPARTALGDAGIEVVGEREAVVVGVADEPGALGSVAERIAAAGVNIEVLYLATGTRLVFCVDDVEAARKAVA